MPVHNSALWLEEAVGSVLSQTFDDWELIIVDDGSSDASPEIIARLGQSDPRIRSLRQENRGAAAARNRAIGLSRSTWLSFLDSDDVWFKQTLEKFHNHISGHPGCKFIHGWRHRLQNGKVTRLKGRHQDKPTGARELFQNMYLSTLCVCYRRDLVAVVGGFDETLPLCEDYDLYLRMSPHVQFEPIGAATGLRRRHASNLSRQNGFSRLVEARVLLRFLEDSRGRDLIPAGEIARRMGKAYYAAGREYFKARCFRQCREALLLAKTYHLPFKGMLMKCLSGVLAPFGQSQQAPNGFHRHGFVSTNTQ